MLLLPIDYALAIWFVLAAASTAYVGVDQYRNNPEPVVMKWGFILITLYLGPVGLLLYVLADKEPRPGEHEAFVKPLWKQGIGSTIHCVAGDATGIILAAAITASLGLPMGVDLVVEYLAGFAVGLLIFQALFMRRMMGGSYWENVRKSFAPEFISMNCMMAGMAPTMSFLMMGRDMRAMEPTELVFWGVMSLGVAVGFAAAYPVNVWMVAAGIKHGLMTERESEPKAHPHEREHGGHAMRGAATETQKWALGGVSSVFLVAGLVAPANWVNLGLSAEDVGGLIMPPGMIMERGTGVAAMRDMSFADPRLAVADPGAAAKGDRELPFRIEDGVKVFDLTASVISWHILPDVAMTAYAYNGQVPGPRIHIRQGDRVRIDLHNRIPEPTTIHWHGLILDNAMDGPAEIVQKPVPTGGSFSYSFTAVQYGTYFYHPHAAPDRTQALGLYGALIIDPANPADAVSADHEYVIELQEWLKRDDLNYPAMPMDGMQPNYFTINGHAYPATDTLHMRVGETLKVRFIGTQTTGIHPMHIHGGPFQIVAQDGETLNPAQRILADTVNIAPGQRTDVIWTARKPGKWLIHCHIPHHTTNDQTETKGGGGLMLVIDVAGEV
jgi:manganese oxidase